MFFNISQQIACISRHIIIAYMLFRLLSETKIHSHVTSILNAFGRSHISKMYLKCMMAKTYIS